MVTVAVPNRTEPAPLRSVPIVCVPPLRYRVAPAGTVTPPPSEPPPLRSRVSLMIVVPVPVLVKGIPKVLVPAPDLVRVPALLKVPNPFSRSNVNAPCTSTVPPARLFSVAPASDWMSPALHTMEPELLIVPFWYVLLPGVLIVAEAPGPMVVVPAVLNEP